MYNKNSIRVFLIAIGLTANALQASVIPESEAYKIAKEKIQQLEVALFPAGEFVCSGEAFKKRIGEARFNQFNIEEKNERFRDFFREKVNGPFAGLRLDLDRLRSYL